MVEPLLWTFEGFTTITGRRVVQEWFSEEITEDDRNAIRDRVAYLSTVEKHLWIEPYFKNLGEGLGEIRKKTPRGGLRIYGAFRAPHVFTFLFGTLKKENNDMPGKNKAKDRLKELSKGTGKFHEFDF